MKLYHFPVAPHPSRVRIYANEKNLPLEQVQVSLGEGEHKSPAHLARNPRAALPVLELDDGSYLTESVPIMEYLEECFPEPPMYGTASIERARIRELERLAEVKILNPTARLVHASNSPLGLPPNETLANVERERLPQGYALMEERLAKHPFIAGDQVTVADCTLFAGLFFGEFFGVSVPDEYANLQRWYADFKLRPSAQT
mgnify:CR=1 FL=1